MTTKKPLVLTPLGEIQNMQNGDFVDVANGGTGAITPAGARTALGLTIGSIVQSWGAGLDALQALSTTGNVVRTGNNVFATRTLSVSGAGVSVSNGDGVAGNPTISLTNDLSALEALGTTGFPVRTATDTWAQRNLVTAARLTVTNGDGVGGNPSFDLATLVNAGGGSLQKVTVDGYGRTTGNSPATTADITALVNGTYLGLAGGTMTGPILLAGDPTLAMHPVTKQYLDAWGGMQIAKPSVDAMSTTNVNKANPGTAIFDGVTLSVGQRLFLVGQTATADNGPWVFNGSGVALSRPADFDTSAEIVSGATFFVDQGTVNSDSNWTLVSSGPYVLGTTGLTFSQTSSLGQINVGTGMTKNGNTINLALSARLTFNGNNIDLAPGIIAPGQYTKVTFDTYGRATAGASATAADVGAQTASNELTGLAALSANGIVVRTASGAYSPRTLIAPAAGIVFSNGDGVAGNPTISLSNDLAALEGLNATGFAVRSAADTWLQRSIVGTARLTVSNGDGVAGNPTIDLPAGVVAAGTYQSVTVDTYGRVIFGSAVAPSSNSISSFINNETTTLAFCTAVYADASGTVKRANANAVGTSLVVGLCGADIGAGALGNVVTDSEIVATTNQWDAVTGQTGGLTQGVRYFLDGTTSGRITTTPPTSGFVCPIGKALSTTRMLISVSDRIQL
jgi:hypothetical protein